MTASTEYGHSVPESQNAATPDMEVEIRLIVRNRELSTRDVVLLTLTPADVSTLPSWSPGAHIEMTLADGMKRHYSLCGDPADNSHWTIAVLREPNSRGGSVYVHDHLGFGAVVDCRGPRNNFPLEAADSYRFIAGGIGITPILPMIRAADDARIPWTLLYGGRSLESMAFRDYLGQYGSKVTLHPQDTNGLLDLSSALSDSEPNTSVYCCGPEPLLSAIEAECETHWPSGALHVERFRADLLDPTLARPIDIELALSGLSLLVPADTSILDAVRGVGVDVDSSCEEGTCGTCEVAVLGGIPEHHDVVLTEAERKSGDCMMICVSRARSSYLTLDL